MSLAPLLRALWPNTIFFKATAVIAAATLAVIGAMAVLSYQMTKDVAVADLRIRATIITDMSAGESAGAMQFRKPEGITALMDKVIAIGGGDLVAAMAVLADGTVLAQHVAGGADTTGMIDLAAMQMTHVEASRPGPGQIAAHQDELGLSPDGMTVAHPAYFGHDNALVGMFVTRWTPQNVIAAGHHRNVEIYRTAAAIFCAALLAAGLVIRSLISLPLNRVNSAMRNVAGGDYDTAIPLIARGDEIGTIARSLEGFRADLHRAHEASLIALLKGSAFEGSSAAMMITDPAFRISFTNHALVTLFHAHADNLRGGYDRRGGAVDLSADRIAGKSLGDMIGNVGLLDAVTSGRLSLPTRTHLRFGTTTFQVALDSVTSATGARIGYVVEWTDVSTALRNAAMIAAIDGSFLRAEFAPDGKIMSENQLFTDAARGTAQREAGQHLADRLRFGAPTTAPSANVIADIAATGGFTGRLVLDTGQDGAILLDATASPVRDEQNNVTAILLLANDVTAAQARLDDAEDQRLRLVAAQQHVVDALRTGLGDLSDGNLTASLDDDFGAEYDTLRDDFNTATARLRGAMADVIANAATIWTETEDISHAATDLSRRTEQQAATLEETAAALDQLNSSVKSAAQTAARANDLVRNVKDHSEKSGHIVRDAVTAMCEIADSSSKISTITGVIDDIAFQTNLLALNAGVEAARAGDAGRGFAVVATEVRALSQRSSDAARQIAALISASSAQVKRGVDLVGQAGTSLTGIDAAITEVAGYVSDIAVSAKEQSAGLSEINTAVNKLDQVTQQNAAMFQETNAAGQSLRSEVRNLRDTISRFHTGSAEQEDPGRAHHAGATRPQAVSPIRHMAQPPARATGVRDQPSRVPTTGFASSRSASGGASGGAAIARRAPPAVDEWQEF